MMGVLIFIKELFFETLGELVTSLQHNWKILLIAIVLAVLIKTYVNSDKLSTLLVRRKKISIFASVIFGAFTPLCACGTTAVIIGMLTTTLPWSPIMAFLTSSPLMSPDGFVFISGVIGLKFAIALTLASVFIGLSSGIITSIIEKRTDFFKHQSRFTGKEKMKACDCKQHSNDSVCDCNTSSVTPVCDCNTSSVTLECDCNSSSVTPVCTCNQVTTKNETLVSKIVKKFKLKILVNEFIQLGLKQILLFYCIFICIGYLINHFIPTSIISVLFGADSFYAVPLAAIIGLPLYITTEAGIPMIQSMIQSGASQGAMLAFLITGSATSAWVIAGLTSFMRKRAVSIYVMFILVGGIVSGYVLDLINLFI